MIPTTDGDWKHHYERMVRDYALLLEKQSALCDLQEEEMIIQGDLCKVAIISKEPLTTKRLKMTYNQGGRKLGGPKKGDPEDWWKTAMAPFIRVYSVGKTPADAIRALSKEIGWGKVHRFKKQPEERPGEWYYRFWTGDGTSMKAAGRKVPGGYTVDWWK